MNNLEKVRKRAGLSSQGLAVKAKISTSTVTAIEKWDHAPQPVTRQKIAGALNVSVADIWETSPPEEEGRNAKS